MSDEKLTALGALAAQAEGMEAADAAEAAAAQGEAPEAGAQPMTNAQMIAGALELARETACALFDLRSPAAVLTDARIEKLGELWGRVADKRGWNLAGALGNYAEEIAALMGTIGIARELAHAVVAELDAKQAAREKAKEDTPEAVVVDG